MKIMKQVAVAFVVMIAICTGKASAQEKMVIYQSTENGVAIAVTPNMKMVKDEETILHLQSPAITFSAHPMLTEKLTAEALTKIMNDTAAAAGLDISKMQNTNFGTNTLEGIFYNGSVGNGFNCIVGTVGVIDNDAVVFLFTLTYADAASEQVNTMLGNFEFHLEAIQ